MSIGSAIAVEPASRQQSHGPRPAPRRIPPQAIRACDIRGLAGRDIDRSGAYALGLAYANRARSLGQSRVGVGRDGRLSSPSLEQALVWGLMDGGLAVLRLGLCSTPMLTFAARELELGGAIMVTASHNPANENGFKILLGEARVHGAALRELVAGPCDRAVCGSSRRLSVLEDYVRELARAAEGMTPLKVAWDCGNGAAGPAVERLTRLLPGRHILLNTRIDGSFPAHHPDPAVAANLSELAETVVARGCDLGVAFDGDGDRLGVVDGQGRILWADQVMLLLARDLLAQRPGAAVVADVKCSRVLFDGIAEAGGRSAVCASGYAPVREAMWQEGAVLGGELSGHIFFADHGGGADDALYAAVQTCLAISRLSGGLPAFRDSLPPTFATPELRIDCAEARKPQVVAEVAARLAGEGATLDPSLGLRVEGPDGWWLLRASDAEAKLSCRCESRHPDGLDRLRAQLRRQLKLSGIEARL
jgi:phosphomannomutase